MSKRRWDDPLRTHVGSCEVVELLWHTAAQDRDHWHRKKSDLVARVLRKQPKLNLPQIRWLVDTDEAK